MPQSCRAGVRIARDELELLLDRQGSQPSDTWPVPARPSDDGTFVTFAYSDPLLPDDINGPATFDVYRLFAVERTEDVFADGVE